MSKLAIVITDGVGYRNFVLSDCIAESQNKFDEVVILSFLPASVYPESNVRIIELEAFQEKFKHWFFRKAKEVAHLFNHKKDNLGIQDNLKTNYSTQKNIRGIATRLIYKLVPYFHSENAITTYTRWQQKTFSKEPITKQYIDLLEQEKFDFLLFTHQRPPYIAPLAYAAQKTNTPIATFIFSWDNLASKGRMASDFNYYLVWSDLMKNELLTYYPKLKAKQVEVVGTPQFEPYVLDRFACHKENFFKSFELDNSKKTICFSCGDIATSKNDALYIETICEAYVSKKIPDINILIRTSPAETPERFSSLVKKYPFVKWNYPKWEQARNSHQEQWSQRIPTIEDVVDLKSILQFTDLNINMLSTMSLDFMCFDKPVINTVFGNEENNLYNDQRFLGYVHIDYVVQSNATKIVKNEHELIKAINLYLSSPSTDSENRKKLLDLQISKPLQGTSKRIAETVFQWSQNV